MKTIRQWFEEYPDPEIRSKLLYNLENDKNGIGATHECESFKIALLCGFVWSTTPEDFGFWNDLYRK